MENGLLTEGQSFDATFCDVIPRTWTKLYLHVYFFSETAQLYLNGAFMTNFDLQMTPRGQGGLLVKNGYETVNYFRNFTIY